MRLHVLLERPELTADCESSGESRHITLGFAVSGSKVGKRGGKTNGPEHSETVK
jgi:hypothetical protein